MLLEVRPVFGGAEQRRQSGALGLGLPVRLLDEEDLLLGRVALEVGQSGGGELVGFELFLGFDPLGAAGAVVLEHVPH